MKLYIYSNYSVPGEFFGGLTTDAITPEELVKSYRQIISGLTEAQLNGLKELDLYCLGEIDNITGQIIPKKDFLLHCGSVATAVLASKKEAVEDGKGA